MRVPGPALCRKPLPSKATNGRLHGAPSCVLPYRSARRCHPPEKIVMRWNLPGGCIVWGLLGAKTKAPV